MSEVNNETQSEVTENTKKIDFSRISEIPVELTIEAGKIKLSLEKISTLKEEDVIPLNKQCDEPFDIKVNNKKIAEGEIVQSENKFYIKVTTISE